MIPTNTTRCSTCTTNNSNLKEDYCRILSLYCTTQMWARSRSACNRDLRLKHRSLHTHGKSLAPIQRLARWTSKWISLSLSTSHRTSITIRLHLLWLIPNSTKIQMEILTQQRSQLSVISSDRLTAKPMPPSWLKGQLWSLQSLWSASEL